MNKIMLGTPDAWSSCHWFQQPSEPTYFIVDCRIFYYCKIIKVSCPFEITNMANPTHFCNLKQCASYKVLKLSISSSKTPST